MKKYYRFSMLIMAVVLMSVVIYQNRTTSAYSEYGSKGNEVKAIQRVLKNEGLYFGNIDGIYGLGTENAVINYQRKYKLKIDGKAGNETLRKMGIYGEINTNDNDVMLLARAISGEARGESYEGQVAVGAVILNRVDHPSFPDTIAGVIYQPGAFSIVDDGQINLTPVSSSVNAARDAINGYDPVYGAIYYYNPRKTSNKFMLSRPVVRIIGQHVFCN